MPSKNIQRIENDPGMKALLETLGEKLNTSDLQSVLIEAARKRSGHIKPSQVMSRFRNSRFLKPSEIPQSVLMGIDRKAYECLPGGFDSVELSPLAPFGSCSSVSNLSQNLVVSTVRHSEVVADPTGVMAIEAASRRRSLLEADPRSARPVKLCTSHRPIRAQTFTGRKFSAHFRVFSLVTAGRDTGHFEFELSQMEEHIRFYLDLCGQLGILQGSEVRVSDFSGKVRTALFETLFGRLASYRKQVKFMVDNDRAEARNYYAPLAFRIRFFDRDGGHWDLVDGGFNDWTRQYLNNRKERLLSSAIGTELAVRVFPELLTTHIHNHGNESTRGLQG